MGLIATPCRDQIAHHHQNHRTCLDRAGFSPEATAQILAYGAPVGALVEYHAQLDRCMTRLHELMDAAEASGTVLAAGTTVLAEELTQALGRFRRPWYAPKGGLWLSLAWPDVLLPEFSRLLPFAVGLACCRCVRSYGVQAHLKWVNDVLVQGKKIAGILCTTVKRPQGDSYHLLGLGLNGNNSDFPPELAAKSSSLVQELGRQLDLAEVAGRLLAELQWTLGLLHYDEAQALQEGFSCEEGRSSLLLAAWHCLSDTQGRLVEYGFDVQEKPLYQATALGLDPCGGLILEFKDGHRTVEYSGEIVYL